MGLWEALGAVLIAGGSFAGGWLAATEKMRIEVYKVRLESYRSIVRKLAAVIMKSVVLQDAQRNIDSKDLKVINAGADYAKAGLELCGEVYGCAGFISKGVWDGLMAFLDSTMTEDITGVVSRKQSEAFGMLMEVMSKDLGIRDSAKINEELLKPAGMIASWGSRRKKMP